MLHNRWMTGWLGAIVMAASLPARAGEATEPEETAEEIRAYDVVLLVDGTAEMAPLSRKSAHVVTEAMGDAHRLAVMTFGAEVDVLQTLSRIATVAEKRAAIQTLEDAAFDADAVRLEVGLARALSHLEKRSTDHAKKTVVLLSGAASSALDSAEVERIRTEVAPRYLAKGVVLHVVALPTANISLLQAAANLTGGKCLAAVNVETMTDALDVLVERLKPPEQIVVTKEVPVAVDQKGAKPTKTPDGHLADIKRDTRAYFITGGFAAVIILLLVVVLYRLQSLTKGVPSEKTKDNPTDKEDAKSGFARLRDLTNTLGNLLVDAKEMSEALNLDLEDFGVETWKAKKALDEKYRDLARSIFLAIDHLAIQQEEAGDQDRGPRWAMEKLGRILEEEGIEEIPVARGDAFDSLFHRHVEEQPSDLAPGSIVEVKRTGYCKREPGGKDDLVVLRQAEVVVSAGGRKGDDGGNGDERGKEV